MYQSGFLQSMEFFGIGSGMLTVIIVAAVLLITAVSLIPMLFVFKKVFGGIKQNRQLLATGEAAQAKILQMRDTGTTLNDNPQVALLLEVYAANRPPYQVETKSFVSRLRIPQVQPGAVVNVKIDPQDASKIALDLA